MKESIFMPILNTDFDVHYWSKTYQSDPRLDFNHSTSNDYKDIESLFRLHSHDALEILIFLGGTCDFFCEGYTYQLQKGDVVIIPPYAVHQAHVTDFNQYERIITNISKPLMNEFLSISPSLKENIIDYKTNGSYLVHLHQNVLDELLVLYQEICERLKEKNNQPSFALHYQLFQAMQLILHPNHFSNPNDGRNKQDPRLNAIIEYIEENLTDPSLNLDNVSNYFHLNKYYFSHYFKKHMNLSFYRYVLLKRLAAAVTLLQENKYSIEMIVDKCGFKDYSSFYRLFKKEYNVSPKKLQKMFRN